MKHEPSSDLLQFLRSKNILPNGYFSLEEPDGTYTFYSVSRSGVLYTLSFQAPDFYVKHGWVVFGRVPCDPVGTCRVFLSKDLSAG